MIFELLLKNKLIFNSCWEDSELDRKLLKINSESVVATITSAGCNSLEYLLDDPKEIHCCDINPAQNAVLELKIVLFKLNDYKLLWEFFGKGGTPNCKDHYTSKIRKHLTTISKNYWDKNINYFSGKKSYYRRGASGKASSFVISYLKRRKSLYRKIDKLFKSNNLENQRILYSEIEKDLWNNFVKILLDNYLFHYFLGVPYNQYRISKLNGSSLFKYLKKNLNLVFNNNPAKFNYYWKVYYQGYYDILAKPAYLDEKNFIKIRDRVGRIKIHNYPLHQVIENEEITQVNLLDHQDWSLGKGNYVVDLWKDIIKNKSINHVLMRTASPNFDLPDEIKEKFIFTNSEEIGTSRVGTYYQTLHAQKLLQI
ncbi:DUF3419 family protein [Candidatus Kapabacteria bacterium]|nr:DUF3419 family protein [Candidatus Kapabacteria bacterium]